jgi:integrase
MRETPNSLSRAATGSVTINPLKGGLRIRWRIRPGERQKEIFVGPTVNGYQEIALQLKTQIESDLIHGTCDETLGRYKAQLRKTVLLELIQEQSNVNAPVFPDNGTGSTTTNLDLLKEFDRFAIDCGQSPYAMTEYYRTTKWLLEKWGKFALEDTTMKLHEHGYSSRSFNHRKTCMSKFFDWLVKKRKIIENPLANVKNKRKDKSPAARDPFTEREAVAILDALRKDLYRNPSSRYSHKQYYSFVAFMLHVGTRNGEAIGLRVKDVDFDNLELKIEHSFSRTQKGTHAAARVLKATKNDNVRLIPIDQYLYDLLSPLCTGRSSGDFVFVTENGNPIDDKMFQRRVWKLVLEKLNIPKRDLYACRHTFATRAVRQGMKPHQVAYIMGDTVETILRTYFHNNLRPDWLPEPVTTTVKNKQVLSVQRKVA